MQGYRFAMDFNVLHLEGCEVVLGTQWLSTLGEISWDFQILTLKFLHLGKRVFLQGLQPTTSTILEVDSFFSGPERKGRVFHISLADSATSVQPHLLVVLADLLVEFSKVVAVPTGLPPIRDHEHSITLKEGSQLVCERPYRLEDLAIGSENMNRRKYATVRKLLKGNLVSQDFDIRKEAGGSYIGIERDFPAQVSENYLEIHFFWAGKGTCCIPVEGTYGPSISVISAINNNPFLVPNATTEFTPSSRSSNGNLIGLIVGISIGVGGILSVFIVFYIIRKRKRLQTNHNEEELLGIDVRPFTFSYAELKTATEDFNPSNKLGEGGFGPVYKGTLNDGRVVAVKQLSAASHQGKNQFVTEIAIMSAVQHRNLVKLYGCCVEADKRHLVYEHLENKSLDQALFGERSLNLNWSTRYDICLGVARGLAYLHEESRLRIVHRDVKASNILLDSDLIPKISDFGLAKLYDDNKSHISTGIAGTIGYLAPEYAMRGHLTEKTDVFAFGIVALEMVSGRRNSDPSLEEEKMYLLEWAWQLHEDKREVDLVDVKLSEFNEEEVKRVIRVSFLCTQSSPTLRPSMSRVVAMLLGDIEVSTVTSKPGYLTDWKSDDPRSLRNDVATRGNVSIYYDYSESSSMVGYIDNSPVSASKPMLGKAIKQGR
nr:probable LRR receptor-like serine/threonine-protein kinase At1g56140 isoform X1 [Quercus suber]XP_023925164.1 probable LRR receptor-like serine/threonine-protein kinase At1g56140 isoform X1 [Quercus suber]